MLVIKAQFQSISTDVIRSVFRYPEYLKICCKNKHEDWCLLGCASGLSHVTCILSLPVCHVQRSVKNVKTYVQREYVWSVRFEMHLYVQFLIYGDHVATWRVF